MNVSSYLRISDLLRKNEVSPVKGKGKGKAVAVDLATNLLEYASKAQEEWEANLSKFKEIIQESQESQRCSQTEFQDDLLESEYGYDLIYNSLPATYYYEDLSDNDSGIYEDGFQDAYSDDQSAFNYVNKSYDKEWLLRQCRLHIESFGDADGAIIPEKLCTSIFTILRSESDDDDDIQIELVDLLGFDNLNFVTTLVTKRLTIVENINNESQYKEIPPDLQEVVPAQKHSNITGPKRPKFGAQFTIQSEEDVKENKRLRKEQKKAAKHKKDTEDEESISANILGFSGDVLRSVRERQLRSATDITLRPQRFTPSENFKHVFGNAQTGSILSVFGSTYSLPVGSKRLDFDIYDEITIPITKRAPQMESEKLINLSEMDTLCRGSFEGYRSLNRVQSLVYPVAYEKNVNLLICAPTGAGKTDIAMLTILRTIRDYCNPEPLAIQEPQKFTIEKNEFKIVYIAPMKALAAEIVKKLGSRLTWLGIQVKELTGDMQLTKAEISNTQIIVTTPEKWDVITRKSTGDVELSQKVKLLIIDEVHLLHDDRGAVLESLVARTRRQVESSQKMIRIVGLSATLPNYVDVARFLGVDLKNGAEGLFYFDGGFRPVPLEQHFIGVHGSSGTISNSNLNRVCWEKVLDLVKEGHQVMVFVHSRKDTVKTARTLNEFAVKEGYSDLFDNSTHPQFGLINRDVSKSKNKELVELFAQGFGIHHAGMLRSDRTMTERLFSQGLIKVLCCTATLAWGVNLPAYAVLIKGTRVYDTQKGNFVDLSILDVMQIFGRAGRPQYESYGIGYILTTIDKLPHYVSAMTQQHPIESKFVNSMVDNLNAEISLGTVTNVDEGVRWLGYTYLFVRMKKNPLVYGMDHSQPIEDPELGKRRRELIVDAAKKLHQNNMIKFYEDTEYFAINDMGRIASNYYIKYNSIETFDRLLKEHMTEADILNVISESSEFEDLKSREEEAKELEDLKKDSCPCQTKRTIDTTQGKVNILLQSYLSNANIKDFALISDSAYVIQNASRIVRALFEIAVNRNWAQVTINLLTLCKCIDKKMWMFENPLAQFGLPREIILKLQSNKHTPSIEEMRDMSPTELGHLVHHVRMGSLISKYVDMFPMLELDAQIAPITRNVLRVTLSITPDFVWNDRIHGTVEPWWIFVEDAENADLYHSEYFILNKKQLGETQKLGFTIPIQEPLPPQLYIRVISDRWIGAETFYPISLNNIVLPKNYHKHTELLNLPPLPITQLMNKTLEEICAKRFSHFNPIQTQVFETLYNSPTNVLIGAPTGSGKTVTAELAMWWAFREYPRSKVVYIAPLKALVRERVDDWQARLTGPMKRRLVELTGDVTPDLHSIKKSDIIITTPEKWDGISRSWQHRSYVQDVSLVIIDEIHLLGGDRGPILEVIVSRMNYISSQTDKKVRIVGLSTALANAQDLADWLRIDKDGLFNFSHTVRPVPLDIHIEGFSGRHYCPRMATMNKPAFNSIMRHSPQKPVIVFVSSRRQTRLTAQDLIAYCCLTENPYHFLRMPEEELQMLLSQIKDNSMKNTLTFGIGLHHAGLTEGDRKIVEELFLNQKIQVLVATSTLAWGVNLPAHLVVIKGTEFYDAKSRGYVDFPITDVLQMMGRAGRPQFDNSGVACIFVQDSKKNFYKKFLYEPFPVESSLHMQLENHFNAEIGGGTIKSKKEAMQYLEYTYLYRRLKQNPAYYGLDDDTDKAVDDYLFNLFEKSMRELILSECIKMDDEFNVESTPFGKIASFFYLSHKTIRLFRDRLQSKSNIRDILGILCDSDEYSELPVRHNEDLLNRDFEKELPWSVQSHQPYDSPHAKAFLLMQAHLTRTNLPISDYVTDTFSVLDQAIRILQAMIDFTIERSMLTPCLHIMSLLQCIKQSRWPEDSSLLILPGIEYHMIDLITYEEHVVTCLGELLDLSEDVLSSIFKNVTGLSESEIQKICKIVNNIPLINVDCRIDTTNDSIAPKEEHTLIVSLERAKKISGYNGKIYAPKFSKQQFESWWLILGDSSSDSIVDMKRVNMRNEKSGEFSNNHTVKLKLMAPEKEGKYQYTIFFISDGYLGIDQQYNIEFNVKEVKQI
ncbi:Sec63 Brl domain-containing protein [Glomus cerebriforme]|uniref:Sec63 Brl domain-containing protein n=1 Tax=Glomus cerebriforme TaxID=658196 RepID=A0A397T242_9GLOM|nr:Sec63 Brl domain-containing protein [Glomus cerebriforme]